MATANIYDLADTWNAGGTTYTAIKMNVTDTASAAASLLMDLQVGGSSKFKVTKEGNPTFHAETGSMNCVFRTADNNNCAIQIHAGASSIGYFGRISSVFGIFDPSGATSLVNEASHVWAQRNGTNAQSFRLYNTYTDGSNYERLTTIWSGNICYISSEAAGTGTARLLVVGGNSDVALMSGGNIRWRTNSSGHFLAETDNTYDIGASGATRPRNIYAAGNIIADTNVVASGGFYPGAGADTGILRDAANVLAQRNSTNAQNFRIYNTYTDGSNGEWFRFGWDGSNIAELGVYQNGTGSVRDMRIKVTGDRFIGFEINSAESARFTSSGLLIQNGGYIALNERSDPSAPSENTGLLYVKDNGSGKSQLVVRFNSGAVQVIATEP